MSATSPSRSRPLDELARRSASLAALVEAASRRRDVRDLRAKIVVLLLALRCPLTARPARPYYVPGAVVRLGAEGLRRAWRGYWGEEAPCDRSMRAHLGVLEGAGVLQRSPGDWLPGRTDPTHPERRPRYPDTFHVLDGEAATEYWCGPGARLLELHPAARHSPDVWRRVFAHWRTGAVQLVFALGGSATPPRRAAANTDEGAAVRARGAALARAVRRARDPVAVLTALDHAGVTLEGGASFRLAGALERARGAAALLARVLMRGDRVRNPAGWLWRAFAHAPAPELRAALAWIGDREVTP